MATFHELEILTYLKTARMLGAKPSMVPDSNIGHLLKMPNFSTTWSFKVTIPHVE